MDYQRQLVRVAGPYSLAFCPLGHVTQRVSGCLGWGPQAWQDVLSAVAIGQTAPPQPVSPPLLPRHFLLVLFCNDAVSIPPFANSQRDSARARCSRGQTETQPLKKGNLASYILHITIPGSCYLLLFVSPSIVSPGRRPAANISPTDTFSSPIYGRPNSHVCAQKW